MQVVSDEQTDSRVLFHYLNDMWRLGGRTSCAVLKSCKINCCEKATLSLGFAISCFTTEMFAELKFMRIVNISHKDSVVTAKNVIVCPSSNAVFFFANTDLDLILFTVLLACTGLFYFSGMQL